MYTSKSDSFEYKWEIVSVYTESSAFRVFTLVQLNEKSRLVKQFRVLMFYIWMIWFITDGQKIIHWLHVKHKP